MTDNPEIQMLAEDMAAEQLGCGFYTLPPHTQWDIYKRAEKQWLEQQISQAEYARDNNENR